MIYAAKFNAMSAMDFNHLLEKLGFSQFYKAFIEAISLRAAELGHPSDATRMLSYLTLQQKIEKFNQDPEGRSGTEFIAEDLTGEEAFIFYAKFKTKAIVGSKKNALIMAIGHHENVVDERTSANEAMLGSLGSSVQATCTANLLSTLGTSKWYLYRGRYYKGIGYRAHEFFGSLLPGTWNLLLDTSKVSFGNLYKQLRMSISGQSKTEYAIDFLFKVSEYCEEIEGLPETSIHFDKKIDYSSKLQECEKKLDYEMTNIKYILMADRENMSYESFDFNRISIINNYVSQARIHHGNYITKSMFLFALDKKLEYCEEEVDQLFLLENKYINDQRLH